MAEGILFVDDDSMVLNALERTFFETEYRTFFALSALDGYKILEKEDIDLVVSDIRMLPVSGADFLREVSIKYPDTIRVVLSAYGDRSLMIKVICEGLAQVYILKPWDNQTLIKQVGHLLAMYDSLSSIKQAAGVNAGRHLPAPPDLYVRMLKMIEEDRSLKEIATLIESDPASTANVLRLANSSFFGMTISSVHQALVYLGISSVKEIALVSELFNQPGDSASNDLRMQVSKHMVCTSVLFNGLHQNILATRVPDEFSVAGLLADIGRLMLIEHDPETYRKIIDAYRQDQSCPLDKLELDNMKYTHAQLGGLILNWWNLPASLVEASLYHHTYPFVSAILPPKVMSLLYIADAYAWQTVERIGSVQLAPELLSDLSITQMQLDELVASVLTKIDF